MTEQFTCLCGRTFGTSQQLKAHKGTCKTNREYSHTLITKICPICGNEYQIERSRSNIKTCSPECGRKLNTLNQGKTIHTPVECVCVVCGKKFISCYPERTKVCSRACVGEYSKLKSFIKKYKLSEDTSYQEFLYQNETVEKQCKYCNKTFLIKRVDYDTKEFCSWGCKCKETAKNALVTKTCPVCGESFMVDPKCTRKTCGKKQCADRLMQATRKERGYLNGFGNPAAQQKIMKTNMEKYGVPYYCMTRACKEANQKVVSSINKKFSEQLTLAGVENTLEYPVGKFSFDISAGKYLIEIDPSYTHSCTTASIFDKPKDLTYHQTKTIIAYNNQFECIHVFDWDDTSKIIEILSSKKRIDARKCVIKTVPSAEANNFLNKYHLQNTLRIQPIKLGLYYNDELVQVMTFGKPRYNKNYEYELLRLCSKGGVVIVGGAQKLWKHFIQEYTPKSVISYCDNSKFNGNIYLSLGMKYEYTTKPSIHWYNMSTNQHITDQLLRQQGADRLIGTNYGKGTDNKQILLDNGFVGVADCGQKIYSWKQVDKTSDV